MTLKNVLNTAKVYAASGWKDTLMKHPLLRLVFIALLAAQGSPSTILA